jgi:spore coat polysaccharide biosynthesis protein SpsF
MENIIFIQARLGSTRLPNKALKKICGKTILELIVERIKNIKKIKKIVLVTGTLEKNKLLVDEGKKIGLEVYCGSEENVLDRFYNASQKYPSNNIIRILTDCPLIDFNVVNNAIDIFENGNYDILSIARKRTFPHGLDFEIFKKYGLEKIWKEKIKEFKNEKEFSSSFINPIKDMLERNDFVNYDLINKKNVSNIRLTIDYQEDFELVAKIYQELYPFNKKFGLKEILQLLEQKPELLNINRKYLIY